MPRYALLLEYDGTAFVGWQRQRAPKPSVQAVLEDAASRLNAGAAVASVAAGRTDAGVHAAGQVVHMDLPPMSPERLRDALNFHLKPHAMAVLIVAPADDGFSARFDAVGRAYRYRILNRRARPALDEGRVWHVATALDVEAMATGARLLLGRHDFTSFRAAACQADSPWRTLDCLRVTRDGDIVEVSAAARSFLHHQVRNIVGTLRLVGDGRWPPDRVAAALAARDRAAAGPTAPAAGLTLMRVTYPRDPFTNQPGRSPSAPGG